jgi:hypothetical protein
MPISRKLEQVIKLIENDLTNVRNDFLSSMGNALIDISPVDTGAYISSHSIVQTKGAGRARTSRNKPTGINPAAAAESARANIASDIASLPEDTTTVFMNNGSPHAQAVEHGGGGWKRPGYQVYTRVKREARSYLQQAVMRNRG